MPVRAAVPALGPADDRGHPQPEVEQVAALLARREPDVGLRPLPRPEVLALAIEPGRPHPVLQRELVGVLDPHPPLLGAVDEEQAGERPERLAAEVVAVLLLDDQHAAPGLDQLVGGHETGQPGADDQHVWFVHRAGFSAPGPARASPVGSAHGRGRPVRRQHDPGRARRGHGPARDRALDPDDPRPPRAPARVRVRDGPRAAGDRRAGARDHLAAARSGGDLSARRLRARRADARPRRRAAARLPRRDDDVREGRRSSGSGRRTSPPR